MIMRTLASALIAFAVLAGVLAPLAAPASAFDGRSYFEQQQNNLP
jgi:hypothetical protein